MDFLKSVLSLVIFTSLLVACANAPAKIDSARPQEKKVSLAENEVAVVDTNCFLDAFDPASFPWKKAQCLNIEEVFKNYRYYQATWDSKLQRLTIVKFIRNQSPQTQVFHWQNQKLIREK